MVAVRLCGYVDMWLYGKKDLRCSSWNDPKRKQNRGSHVIRDFLGTRTSSHLLFCVPCPRRYLLASTSLKTKHVKGPEMAMAMFSDNGFCGLHITRGHFIVSQIENGWYETCAALIIQIGAE